MSETGWNGAEDPPPQNKVVWLEVVQNEKFTYLEGMRMETKPIGSKVYVSKFVSVNDHFTALCVVRWRPICKNPRPKEGQPAI